MGKKLGLHYFGFPQFVFALHTTYHTSTYERRLKSAGISQEQR